MTTERIGRLEALGVTSGALADPVVNGLNEAATQVDAFSNRLEKLLSTPEDRRTFVNKSMVFLTAGAILTIPKDAIADQPDPTATGQPGEAGNGQRIAKIKNTPRPGASATPRGWGKFPKKDSPGVLTERGNKALEDAGKGAVICLGAVILGTIAHALTTGSRNN